jgi:hypothetical protein
VARLEKYPPLPGPAGVHAAPAGGTPAWQIMLIAASAAPVAALAVTACRMRAARWRVTTAVA